MPRAEYFAKRLHSDLAVIVKRRPEPDVSEVTHIVGDVRGRIAVVVDDMISTGGTLVKAAEGLHRARGYRSLQPRDARHLRRRRARPTRTLADPQGDRDEHDPANDHGRREQFEDRGQLSIAQILADAIKRITANRSVSELFAREDLEDETYHPVIEQLQEAVAATP